MVTVKMQRGSVRAAMTKVCNQLQDELKKVPRDDLRCKQLYRHAEEVNVKVVDLNGKILESLLLDVYYDLDQRSTQDDIDAEYNKSSEY